MKKVLYIILTFMLGCITLSSISPEVQAKEIDLSAYSAMNMNVYQNSRVTALKTGSNGSFTATGYMFNDSNCNTPNSLYREIIFVNEENPSTEYAYRKVVTSKYDTYLNKNANATQNGKYDLSYAYYTVSVNPNSMSNYSKTITGSMRNGSYLVYMRISDGKTSYLFPLKDITLSDGTNMENTGTLPTGFEVINQDTRELRYVHTNKLVNKPSSFEVLIAGHVKNTKNGDTITATEHTGVWLYSVDGDQNFTIKSHDESKIKFIGTEKYPDGSLGYEMKVFDVGKTAIDVYHKNNMITIYVDIISAEEAMQRLTNEMQAEAEKEMKQYKGNDSVYLNGKEYKNGDTLYLVPGEYYDITNPDGSAAWFVRRGEYIDPTSYDMNGVPHYHLSMEFDKYKKNFNYIIERVIPPVGKQTGFMLYVNVVDKNDPRAAESQDVYDWDDWLEENAVFNQTEMELKEWGKEAANLVNKMLREQGYSLQYEWDDEYYDIAKRIADYATELPTFAAPKLYAGIFEDDDPALYNIGWVSNGIAKSYYYNFSYSDLGSKEDIIKLMAFCNGTDDWEGVTADYSRGEGDSFLKQGIGIAISISPVHQAIYIVQVYRDPYGYIADPKGGWITIIPE